MRYIISPVYHWSAPRSYTSLDMLETPHLKGVYNANWSDAIWLFSVRRSSDSTLSESEEAHFCHLILSAIYCLWPGEGKTNQV